MGKLLTELGRQIRLSKLSSAEEVRRSEDCLAEDQIAGYADGRMELSERVEVEKHLADCRYCLGQLGLLARLDQQTETASTVPASLLKAAKQLTVEESPSFRSGGRWASGWVAALLMVALGLAFQWAERGRGDFVLDSSVRAVDVARSVPEVRHPREGARVSMTDFEVRWSGVAGAMAYEIRLVDSSGDLVWMSEAQGLRKVVPPDLEIATGKLHFVWVRALLPDGRTLKSTAVGFQVGDD